MAFVLKKRPEKKKISKPIKDKMKATDTEILLPTVKSLPSENLGAYSMLLYGEKKIGKTSMASMFPEALFCMFEPGGKALSIYQIPIKRWEDFLSVLRLLKKDKKFKTIIIDPVDIAYVLCLQYVCKRLGIEHPSDEEWGKGWQAVREEFTMRFNDLLELDKGVILISHAADKEIKTRLGKSYHKVMATMPGQAREALEGIVDIWVYYCYQGRKRTIILGGDDHIGAGHRLKGKFKYSNGESITEIPAGNSEEEAYRNFIDGFHNRLSKKEVNVEKKKLILKKGGK